MGKHFAESLFLDNVFVEDACEFCGEPTERSLIHSESHKSLKDAYRCLQKRGVRRGNDAGSRKRVWT